MVIFSRQHSWGHQGIAQVWLKQSRLWLQFNGRYPEPGRQHSKGQEDNVVVVLAFFVVLVVDVVVVSGWVAVDAGLSSPFVADASPPIEARLFTFSSWSSTWMSMQPHAITIMITAIHPPTPFIFMYLLIQAV